MGYVAIALEVDGCGCDDVQTDAALNYQQVEVMERAIASLMVARDALVEASRRLTEPA